MREFTFFLFLVLWPIGRSDYGGYDAARTEQFRSGGEHDPLLIDGNLPHKPNEYENAPHLFWAENRPFAHTHVGHPETFNGKLHQHRNGGNEIVEGNNFITDPPNVGLNSPENRDNYKKPVDAEIKKTSVDFDLIDEYPSFANTNAQMVHPSTLTQSTTHSSASSVDNTISQSTSTTSNSLPYNSAHAAKEEIEVETKGQSTTTNDTRAHVSAHGSEYIETSKKSCCPCCAETSKQPNRSIQSTFVSLSSYVQPSISSPAPNNPFASYGQVNSGCGNTIGSYNVNCQFTSYGQSSCCPQVPTCCIPQLPCCPKIEFPCCPQQPLCCQSQGCGVCRSRTLRARRVKRFGCIPCGGRRKRDVLEEIHVRRKRLGCVPCLRRKKREQPQCIQCSPFTQRLVSRVKRSFLSTNCSPCSAQKLRMKRATEQFEEVITQAVNVHKRSTSSDLEYDSFMQCDKSCCDYTKCIRSKPLRSRT